MSLPAGLYSVASAASERLLFSLGMGMLLAAVVWLLLRISPRKDSRTSFAVWFATLLITAALPVVSLYSGPAGRGAEASSAMIMVPATWAVYFFLGWAVLACLGVARVTVALWQVRRLRKSSRALEPEELAPELRELAGRSGRWRAVELRASRRLEVPTAVGFFKPAVLLPEWLLEETPEEELKYILLHEFEHLRRGDDWTNLAQQVVKALLFFVPSVWWIERRLALDREIACDDAVLEQSGTPRGYAECLARVAERSFLRRQLALAQAAVSKLRQLTVRVARILDPNRQQTARMWRPAVPAVIVVAGLCAFSASQAPSLIGFANGVPAAQHTSHGAAGSLADSERTETMNAARLPELKMVSASLKQDMVKAGAMNTALNRQQKSRSRKPQIEQLSNLRAANKIPRAPMALIARSPEYVVLREEFVMVVSQRADAAPQSWQMHVVTIVMQTKPQKQVPKKI